MKNKLFISEKELTDKGVKEGLNKLTIDNKIARYINSQTNKNNSNTNNKTIKL